MYFSLLMGHIKYDHGIDSFFRPPEQSNCQRRDLELGVILGPPFQPTSFTYLKGVRIIYEKQRGPADILFNALNNLDKY